MCKLHDLPDKEPQAQSFQATISVLDCNADSLSADSELLVSLRCNVAMSCDAAQLDINCYTHILAGASAAFFCFAFVAQCNLNARNHGTAGAKTSCHHRWCLIARALAFKDMTSA